MKIPIHALLEKFGLTDLDFSDPKDIEKLKKELDEMLEEEKEKENLLKSSNSDLDLAKAYEKLYKA